MIFTFTHSVSCLLGIHLCHLNPQISVGFICAYINNEIELNYPSLPYNITTITTGLVYIVCHNYNKEPAFIDQLSLIIVHVLHACTPCKLLVIVSNCLGLDRIKKMKKVKGTLQYILKVRVTMFHNSCKYCNLPVRVQTNQENTSKPEPSKNQYILLTSHATVLILHTMHFYFRDVVV